MKLTRNIIENLFLQIVDNTDGYAILDVDIYAQIDKEVADLDDYIIARNKDGKHDYILKYIAANDTVQIQQRMTDTSIEQSPNTNNDEEAATE